MGIEQEELANIIRRLKRVEGQIRGLQGMVENGRSLEEVLNQMAASKSAFDEAALLIIAQYMKECLGKDLKGCEKAISKALNIFVKYANYMK